MGPPCEFDSFALEGEERPAAAPAPIPAGCRLRAQHSAENEYHCDNDRGRGESHDAPAENLTHGTPPPRRNPTSRAVLGRSDASTVEGERLDPSPAETERRAGASAWATA